MIDTWGTYSGVLHGHFLNPGLFKDCLSFQYGSIEGHYCQAQIKALPSSTNRSLNYGSIIHDILERQNLTLQNGICVPKSCSTDELWWHGNKLLADSNYQWENIYCYEPSKLDYFDHFVT